jgi:hypothetical protein
MNIQTAAEPAAPRPDASYGIRMTAHASLRVYG